MQLTAMKGAVFPQWNCRAGWPAVLHFLSEAHQQVAKPVVRGIRIIALMVMRIPGASVETR
jgi:hypothetical protein